MRGTLPVPIPGKAGWDLCDVEAGSWFFTFLVMARTRSLACLRL